MSSTELAYINPAVVSWAIKRSGKTYKQIEKSLKASQDQIATWEKGIAHPSFSKAIKLAEVLRVPFGYLFLDAPPIIEVPLPDFRKFPDSKSHPPSIDLLDVLYSTLAQHDWYKEYAIENNAKPLTFVSSFTIRSDVTKVAQDISRRLALPSIRREANGWSDFLTKLTRSTEAIGILVMRSGIVGNNTRRPLSVREFQGFAITDPLAPLVFINTKDFESAKIFTLLHELAHIWTGQSGISLADETKTITSTSDVESFCNAVAAEALVPRDEFLSLWHGRIDIGYIQKLARRFHVSSLVILRRARELNRLSVPEFIGLLESARQRMTAKKLEGGGNYHVNVEARHSTTFIEALINDVRRGKTMYREAAGLLDVSVPTLEKYVEGKQAS